MFRTGKISFVVIDFQVYIHGSTDLKADLACNKCSSVNKHVRHFYVLFCAVIVCEQKYDGDLSQSLMRT